MASVAVVELACVSPLVALEFERSIDWSVVEVLLAAGVVAESLLILPVEVLEGEVVVLFEVAEFVLVALVVD